MVLWVILSPRSYNSSFQWPRLSHLGAFLGLAFPPLRALGADALLHDNYESSQDSLCFGQDKGLLTKKIILVSSHFDENLLKFCTCLHIFKQTDSKVTCLRYKVTCLSDPKDQQEVTTGGVWGLGTVIRLLPTPLQSRPSFIAASVSTSPRPDPHMLL